MNRVFNATELEGVTTFWRVSRRDGVTLGFTGHDRDLWLDGVLHRAALRSDAARHTALTNVFTGRPARSIVNRFMAELGPIAPDAPGFPLPVAAFMPLRGVAERQGSDAFSPLWAGQNVTGCREIPAAALTQALAARA